MSYVKHVIQPDEKIVIIGKLHWIVYRNAVWFLIAGVILLLLEHGYSHVEWAVWPIKVAAGACGVATLFLGIKEWFTRWTTEIAVTNKRIIYKRGFITRHTAEMNMDKVASVDVDQTIWGRMLDYGSIRILGTGGATGIERLDRIGSPIALRNAIDVR